MATSNTQEMLESLRSMNTEMRETKESLRLLVSASSRIEGHLNVMNRHSSSLQDLFDRRTPTSRLLAMLHWTYLLS